MRGPFSAPPPHSPPSAFLLLLLHHHPLLLLHIVLLHLFAHLSCTKDSVFKGGSGASSLQKSRLVEITEMEVLQMYDPDTGKKKPSRVRSVVRLVMRLHHRWKALTRFSKGFFVLIAAIVLLAIGSAIYTHSSSSSSATSSEEWRRQLGRSAWHFLHTTAAQLPDRANITATQLEAFRSIFRSLEIVYPCEECREHLVQNMKRMRSLDAVIDAPSALVWTCELHNIVNEAQKKDLFPCDPDILAKKWSNPNCGCRSRKSSDAASSLSSPDSLPSHPSAAPLQGHAQAAASVASPQAKADAIMQAQAKIKIATQSPPPAIANQDSDAQGDQRANVEPVPDSVLSPDEAEA